MESLKLSKGTTSTATSTSSSSANNASSSSTNKSSASVVNSNANSATSSTNTSMPITVRFNAGDECIDDIFQSFHHNASALAGNVGGGGAGGGGSGGGGGSSTNLSIGGGGGGGDSLSTSPSQQHHQIPLNNPDELNSRNNFLQGNFFNRKRSGSIEGISPTSVGPNLIAALSSSDAASTMGTWKMIKGKVSQTIEDIKASKTISHTTMTPPVYPTVVIKGGHQTPVIDCDSDQETKTSVSEDLSVEQDRRSSAGSSKHKRSGKLEDSDTDFENEILLEGDIEHSRIRRGFANLKSKVKAKHEAHQAKKATLSTAVGPTAIPGSIKKDISPSRSTGSSSSSTSIRGTFLRKRRQKGVEQGDLISPENISPISALAATVVSGELAAAVPVVMSAKPAKKMPAVRHKKDIEIESGVEMLEDMIPPTTSNTGTTDSSISQLQVSREALDLPLSQLLDSSPPEVQINYIDPSFESIQFSPYQSLFSSSTSLLQKKSPKSPKSDIRIHWEIINRFKNFPILTFGALVVVLLLPIHDFIRGVLCCLLVITIVDTVWDYAQGLLESWLLTIRPERTKFNIPDYSRMEILQIPAVEEFKTVKSYDGWMNEADCYDPNKFHINMTRPVYVKLEGSSFHVFNTNARIPKRMMWNEPPIDRKSIIFTTHRRYNLLGCRIELLPIGLAKKRYFNRKYPLQLIVKQHDEQQHGVKKPDDPQKDQSKRGWKKRSFHNIKAKQEKQGETGEIKSTSETKPTQPESIKTEAEIDFGATIMKADHDKKPNDPQKDQTKRGWKKISLHNFKAKQEKQAETGEIKSPIEIKPTQSDSIKTEAENDPDPQKDQSKGEGKKRSFHRLKPKQEKQGETGEIESPIEIKPTQSESIKTEAENDFGATIMKADHDKKPEDPQKDQSKREGKKRSFHRLKPKQEKQGETCEIKSTLEIKSTFEIQSSYEIKPTQSQAIKTEKEIYYGTKVDLQKLQDDVNPDDDLHNITVPCGDEVRLLLFTRGAREKEDWYRRFLAASSGDVHDRDLNFQHVKFIDDKGLHAAATKAAQALTNPKPKETNVPPSTKPTGPALEHQSTTEETLELNSQKDEFEKDFDFIDPMPDDADLIEGLLMTTGAARNEPDYVKFMSYYQKACKQTKIPVYKGQLLRGHHETRRHKRSIRIENELWKGIDQSLFLGPSGSVVWANVLVGRILFSALENEQLMQKFQYIMQKKLNSIKLPGFMEEVIIKNIDLGDKPPLIHRVSQPVLDERGIWLDMDVTYEGLCHITVTTKLNLLRLKRPPPPQRFSTYASNFNLETAQSVSFPTSDMAEASTSAMSTSIPANPTGGDSADKELFTLEDINKANAVYDSDAESTGSSSTESDNSMIGTGGDNPNSAAESAASSANPGNARRIFKFVDRLATSNFFQYATELSYVQKAMENMCTTITLGIDLHGLVSRVTLNLPPPPSDRLWLAFRAPPRLWLTARPTVGDKSVDWSIVTNIIEGKLCEAVNKYLVFPNMIDLLIPILGKQPASEGEEKKSQN